MKGWVMDSRSHDAADATIPSELMGQLPRRVRVSENSLLRVAIAYVLLALAAAGALWTGAGAVQPMQQRTALRASGSRAVGTITGVGRVGTEADISVRYSFSGNGQMFTGKSAVPKKLVSDLQAGGSLPIMYLAADPAINHPAAWEWSANLLWDSLFGPIIFAVAGLISLLLVRRQRRFVVSGVPVLAAVTACALGSGRAGWYTVKYEFRADDGRTAGGSMRSESAQDVGAKICVLYVPRNPKRNLPYASASYRVAER